MLLVGRSGVGKSTLLRSMPDHERFRQDRFVECRSARDLDDVAHAARGLAHEFGIRRGGAIERLLDTDGSKALTPGTSEWTEYDISELLTELHDRDVSKRLVIRVDHCEAAVREDNAKLVVLRGICRAAAVGIRVVLVVRQDALGHLLDTLDTSLGGRPGVVLLQGLPLQTAVPYAIRALQIARHPEIDEAALARLIQSLTSDGHVWPVALNAVVDELIDSGSSSALLDPQQLARGGVRTLLGASLERKLSQAPEGLGVECYWVLKAVSRATRQGNKATHRLLRALTASQPHDLERVLSFLATVKLVASDLNGHWYLTHEAVALALEGTPGHAHYARDLVILEAVDAWIGSGAVSRENVEVIIAVMRTGALLPLAALLLVGAAIAKGVTGDFCATTELLRKGLARHATGEVVAAVRSLKSRSGGAVPAFVDASLLYLGRPESVREFLLWPDRAALTDSASLSWWDVERLLMGADAGSLSGALTTEFVATLSTGGRLSVCRVVSRRDDVRLDTATTTLLAEGLDTVAPDLVLAVLGRFAPEQAGATVLRFLQDPSSATRIAALNALLSSSSSIGGWDLERFRVHTRRLSVSTNPLERRRCVAIIAAQPETFDDVNLPAVFSLEQNALVREGILEVISAVHPSAEVVLRLAMADQFDFVRESCVYAANRCNIAESTLRELIKVASSDTSGKVREAAVRIAKIRNLDISPETLLSGLRSSSDAEIYASLQVVGASDHEGLQLALAGLVFDESRRSELRSSALLKLGEVGGEVAAVCIESLLGSNDISLLSHAIVCAQMSSGSRLLGSLIRLTLHPIVGIRESALYAVAEAGGDQAIEAALRAILDPVAEIRQRAVYALLRLGARQEVRKVEHLLRFEVDPGVMRALDQLRQIDSSG